MRLHVPTPQVQLATQQYRTQADDSPSPPRLTDALHWLAAVLRGGQ